MSDFLNMLERHATKDALLLHKAVEAAQKATAYSQAEKTAAPTPEVISYARAMRTIQLGESIKILIRAGVIGRKERLTDNLSAKTLGEVRDNLAHPDNPLLDDVAVLYKEKKQLLEKFSEMKSAHPDNKVIDVCMTALRKILDGPASETVWQDAANYSFTACGSFLESMTDHGQKILNKATVNFAQDSIMDRRNLLSHAYEENKAQPLLSAFPETVLANAAACIVPTTYKNELIGARTEPEIESVTQAWIEPPKGSTQTGYSSYGCRIVAEEVERLAKTGADASFVLKLSGLLMVSRLSPKELEKFMDANFPDGLDAKTKDSLIRLDTAAKNNYILQRNKNTGLFEASIQKIAQIAEAREAAKRGPESHALPEAYRVSVRPSSAGAGHTVIPLTVK